MKKTLALVATAVALALASPSFAAGKAEKANAQICESLLKEVDDALATHKTSSKHADAEKKRTEGAKACSEGKHEQGVKNLHAALKDLGVKPTAKESSTRSGY